MTVHCPCCGQPVNAGRAPIEALEAAPLANVPRTIVNALVRAYPRPVPAEQLISAVYSGTIEPDFARSAITVQLSRIRDKIALYGWTVSKGRPGRGNTSSYPPGAPAMSRRHTMSPEARAREREANRLRMARLRQDPEYQAKVNARRKERDRERKAAEPELVERLRINRKRYFESRKDDPAFWAKRREYLRRWRRERFLDEAFEDFMKRIEAEEKPLDQQLTPSEACSERGNPGKPASPIDDLQMPSSSARGKTTLRSHDDQSL